ncbi:hypothetical protein PC116_g17634 [Phytophthora cactorum]|uniref:Uncharacterized protein n=1 Tax=Phytophthora cactorum TaxID=29920 RepID=A0A8T1CSB5_9STRA|nr:hypothetical protein Pcac1_g1140 [Phytophthora cactorum]KAG2896925.1 hypothetical protein PC114_g14889 [Phytophthora cactorum]KAG2928137.1 hypothetical protein PC117_g14401 [Phytophthora cactorum]KAG3007347.1 hypothetical protein PC119_g14617 [Phytophthora cactorum]KAG3017766.1 hypothetical protein PC120_g10827 [Phytophthora cactorum]
MRLATDSRIAAALGSLSDLNTQPAIELERFGLRQVLTRFVEETLILGGARQETQFPR